MTSTLLNKSFTERFTLQKENENLKRLYQELRSNLWPPNELTFKNDKEDYNNPKTPARYKQIYKQFLQFFACGDGAITEQLVNSQLKNTRFQEERMFIILQLLNENDHSETYKRAIKEVIPEEEWDEVFGAVEDLECVKAKVEFGLKWTSDEVPSNVQYFARAFTERVFFITLFTLVFFFRRKNLFKDFIAANKFIIRDETSHGNFDIVMATDKELNEGLAPITPSQAHAIAMEAYEIEKKHLYYIFSSPIDSEEADKEAGITPENIDKFIQTLINQIMILSKFETIFDVPKNTSFDWMKDIDLILKKNFYEALVTEYTDGEVVENEDEW